MYHPTTRVLTVLELLQSHTRMSARELAERLEVNTRTVRNYIAMLQDLGIPVEGERGRYGAYRLRPGFKLPPLMFTEDEAVALTLGLLTARKFGLTVAAPSVEGALAKVERVLPTVVRERVQTVQETVIIDAESPYLAPTSETLVALTNAAQRCERVLVRYAAWDGNQSQRAFDTYGVVHHGGRWYAAGFCHLRQDMRVFRLDRMQGVEPLGEQFERRPHPAILEMVWQAIARTPGRWQVVVHLEATLEYVQRHVGPSLALLEPSEHGVLMSCYVQQLDWPAHMLLGFDCPITIIAPDELRTTMREIAQRANALAEG